jgi:hypothetical protein
VSSSSTIKYRLFRHSFRMRQLSLLVATTLAFFIMLSVFLMSRTSTLHEPIVPNIQTTPEEASKLDELAMRTSGTSLDLIESGVALIQPEIKNPVTPGLTHGHVIMPTLSNETIKYVKLVEWLIIGPNLDGRVGSYFTLFSRDFLKPPHWTKGRH